MFVIYPYYDRLVSFSSVHHGMRAEKLLAEAGIPAVAAPTPREVDISCGQCLLFAAENERAVITRLTEGQVCWSKLFIRDGERKSYRLIRVYNKEE
ncbi:DUF3343 domain-containing protein [Anaerospora hongkongensis]|uniref:DUF3343 domain-containing protein n=1 Tax=Anaerospora hongkongensis TaxID=244830 RepID=UPI00289A2864|nr:DUF3343 domain-containing protein [Anaerospora hongkongensis]